QQQWRRVRSETLERRKALARSRCHGAGHAGGPLQQVGTPNVTGKNEISRKGTYRVLRSRFIGQKKGQMFRRVSRRVHNIETNFSGADLIAMAYELHSRFAGEDILPVFAAFRGNIQRGSGAPGQLAASPDLVL